MIGTQGLTSLGVGRVSPTSGIGGFVFSAQSDAFNLLIRALKTQGRIDILSRPQVMTLDNQSASVLVGQSVPYISSTNVTATGLLSNGVSYRNVGVELQVTPRIGPDGKVLMRVEPSVSSVATTSISLGNGVTAVAFNVQDVTTTVTAQDGETVAIGGLISRNDAKNENKVPWLGDLPYIGAAFRYRTQVKSKTELLVILTPHVVRNRMEADRVLAEEAARMDWMVDDVTRYHGLSGMDPVLHPAAVSAAAADRRSGRHPAVAAGRPDRGAARRNGDDSARRDGDAAVAAPAAAGGDDSSARARPGEPPRLSRRRCSRLRS